MAKELIDEFYSVNLRDDWLGVSREGALKIIEQFKAGRVLLEFEDLYGSFHAIPARCFFGLHLSTTEYRQTVREHNDMMKTERKNSVGWTEDE